MKDGLDGLDLSICEMLESRGRVSNRQISRALGVSEGTVRARVRRLQAEGLLRVIAVRNLDRPPTATAHLAIFVEPGRLRAVAEELAAVPGVLFVAIAAGHCDIVAMCVAPDRDRVSRVVAESVATIPGVIRVDTTETVQSVKFVPNLRKMR